MSATDEQLVWKAVVMVEKTKDKEILSFNEFADLIGVKKTTLYKIMQSPLAPKFTRIGSIRIITKSDALKWVEESAGLRIY